MRILDKCLLALLPTTAMLILLAAKYDATIYDMAGYQTHSENYYLLVSAMEIAVVWSGMLMVRILLMCEEMLNDMERERKKILIRDDISKKDNNVNQKQR